MKTFVHEIVSKSSVENKSGRLNVFASTISDALLQRGETQGKPISAPHILALSAEGLLFYLIPTNNWHTARDGNCGLSFTRRPISSILQSLNQISLSRDGTSSMKSTHLSLRSAMERTRICKCFRELSSWEVAMSSMLALTYIL